MSLNMDNLEMKYKQLYEISLQIGELIERGLYNEISTYAAKKDKVLAEVIKFSQKITQSGEDSSYLRPLCLKIEAQEKKNLEALNKIREEIKEELHKSNQTHKIVNEYSSSIPESGNILDCSE